MLKLSYAVAQCHVPAHCCSAAFLLEANPVQVAASLKPSSGGPTAPGTDHLYSKILVNLNICLLLKMPSEKKSGKNRSPWIRLRIGGLKVWNSYWEKKSRQLKYTAFCEKFQDVLCAGLPPQEGMYVELHAMQRNPPPKNTKPPRAPWNFQQNTKPPPKLCHSRLTHYQTQERVEH